MKTKRFRLQIATLAILGAAALPAQAAVFLAGTDAGCQFASIQAAVNAAAANPGADTVRIASSGTYTAQAITIGAQDLTIDGDFANCTDATPSGGGASVSGQGGATAAVFRITGAGSRRFKNVTIIRGDNVAGDGGGISFDGSGELVLSKVTLLINVAGFGGAINFRGAGAPAVLTLLANTNVLQNQALTGGGGGIRLEGNGQLFAEEPRIVISDNLAPNGEGGGVLLLDDAQATISSEGFGAGVIINNSARNGGGAAVVANTEDDQGILLMYSSNAAKPVSLQNNIASGNGGAIYLKPIRIGGRPRACLRSFHLTGNRAQNGAAIYGDSDVLINSREGVSIALNTSSCGISTFNLVDCTPNQNGCNTIQAHVSETTAGVATQGATMLIQDRGDLNMKDMVFFNNRGGSLIRTIEARNFSLENALVVGNTLSESLVRLNSFAVEDYVLRHMTIASNSIGGTQVIQFEDGPEKLKFNHNLIFQPGKTSVTLPFAIANSANYNWDYNATSDTAQILPLPWQSIGVDPRFNSAVLGDFRLRVGSRLVDRFPNIPAVAITRDLDDRPRPTNLTITPGSDSVDVGAFERQEADPWLLNGNFDGNLNYWPSDNPGLTSYSALNATGSTGGSVQFSRPGRVDDTVGRYNVLVQCFNVPAAGVYRLSGFGRGTSNLVVTRAQPVIRWRLRPNSANCAQADPIALEGDVFFPSQPAFAASVPFDINVSAAQFGPNATIELRLDTLDRLIGSPETNLVGFDKIELRNGSEVIEPLIFANGFE